MGGIFLIEVVFSVLYLAFLISLGHDEYWTKEMRDGVEHARDRGISLAFLAAEAAYWQMRFEPDSAGRPDRTIVCYKVQTNQNDLAHDPLLSSHPWLELLSVQEPFSSTLLFQAV